MRNRFRWIVCVASLTCTLLVGVACGLFQVHDYVEFTPPPAQISPRADCGLPAITQQLSNVQSRTGSTVDGAGSIPKGFSADKVVRCERGEDAAGNATIDAVTLDGDIDAVSDAFRIRSRRTPKNVSVSCAFGPTEPVALWLTAADGSAIRPQWPLVVCGYRDEPLAPLRALREVGRTTVTVVGDVATSLCAPSTGMTFRTSREAGAAGASGPRERIYKLATPTDDVGSLTLCRYRVNGEASALIGSRILHQDDSRRVVTAGAGAPVEGECDLTATEVVSATLFRPDGSGGGEFLVEVDGCRRFMLPFMTGYRAMPESELELLRS